MEQEGYINHNTPSDIDWPSDNVKMRIKIQVSAKGLKYGEYSFKGDNPEEIKSNGDIVKKIFEDHLK